MYISEKQQLFSYKLFIETELCCSVIRLKGLIVKAQLLKSILIINKLHERKLVFHSMSLIIHIIDIVHVALFVMYLYNKKYVALFVMYLYNKRNKTNFLNSVVIVYHYLPYATNLYFQNESLVHRLCLTL